MNPKTGQRLKGDLDTPGQWQLGNINPFTMKFSFELSQHEDE
jgi:hypothetical protein